MQTDKFKTKKLQYNSSDKALGLIKYLLLSFQILNIMGCSDFVEVDPPKNILISKTVFEEPATVASAMANIYYNMREQGMVSGNYGLSIAMGSYADELDYYGLDTDQLNLYNHNVSANNTTISNWWSHAYNLIYAVNDIISGIEQSASLNLEDSNRYKGQALFIRGYLHSLLVDLYGDIPYITTTNYLENNIVARMPVDTVYEYIIADLVQAVDLLDSTDETGEHVIPNKVVANALLARMYLYTENWDMAEATADALIRTQDLELDINKVFLRNSKETLWQFKPGGPNLKNTQEAGRLIITFIPTQGYALSNSLLSAFEPGDLRYSNWIGNITSDDGLTTLYYAHKYKETINTTTASLEYSVIFRLTEQYFIRSEARAHLGDIAGAQADINAIRNRAGLGVTMAATKDELLNAIGQERRVELFTECGHRWFDLKRLGQVGNVLGPIKPNWRPTDILFPIPETELEVNPNLKPQNTGY
jgi:hypothetical protein